MQKAIGFFCAAAALGFLAPVSAEDDASPDEAPATVKAAAMAAVPGGELTELSIDEDDGVKVYEFDAVTADGDAVEIDVLEDGTVEEIEQEIALADVPPGVLAKLEETAPGFQAEEIERSSRPGGVEIYEFEGEHDGQEAELEIDADGQLLIFELSAD